MICVLLGRSFGRLALLLLPLLVSCAGVDPQRYANEKPALALEAYFNGPVDAWGVVHDRGGAVIRRFTVRMTGTWRGNTGTLDEDFFYSDGVTEKRVWTIVKTGPGRYQGRADDVIGVANGQAAVNALNWRYTLRLPVGDTRYDIEFDDWMYLVDEEVMINKAVMTKFGIRVGEVLISFRKQKTP